MRARSVARCAGVKSTLIDIERAFHGFLMFPYFPFPDSVTSDAWGRLAEEARRYLHTADS